MIDAGMALGSLEMNAAKRKQIGALADEVRRALRLTTPVTIDDLRAAVTRLGGRVISASIFEHEASIRRVESGFEVSLDETKPPKRQIFSLAHELGHLFVHMGLGSERWMTAQDYIESYARHGYDEEEFEAHEFAAALLMPEDEFRGLDRSGRSVDEMADKFGVSKDAALMRGRWLGLYSWS